MMINDSGARREFETGAVRDIQEGKGRCDLLPLDVVATGFVGGTKGWEAWTGDVLYAISEFQKIGVIEYLWEALMYFGRHVYSTSQDEYSYFETMLLEVSKHFEEGAKKYGEYNWQKGIPTHCYIDSAVRHFLKFIRGDKDEPHDRAFVWNILCCMWTCKNKPELNDYPRKENEEPKKEESEVEKYCGTCMYPGFYSKDPTCAICAATSGFDNIHPKWIPKDEIKEGNT